MFRKIEVDIIDSIAVIALNSPENMNAISSEMLSELEIALDQVEGDSSLRALLLWGTEKYFCTGGDLVQISTLRTVNDALALSRKTHRVYNRLEALSIPTVAAVAGPSLGGGLEIALACDFRIGNEKTKLGLPEVTVGLIPGGGGTQRLTRLVGISRALEIMLLGEPVRAEEAQRLGLLNRLAPVGGIYEAGLAFARRLAALPPYAAAYVKRLVRMSADVHSQAGLEQETMFFAAITNTEDAAEGIQAFREKRTPKYTGK